MTVRMELAAALHHSAFRGAGPETYDALRSQKTVNSREGTEFYAMFEDSDVVGGGRPPSLVDVRRQERVQQRTVKQIVDPVPWVPLLHDVVPQMVEQLVDFLAPLDFRVPEEVIEVPKIVCPRRAARTILDVPQMAEQLVEVPTIMSFISLQQQTVEQIVDIPVPHRRRRGQGGLQGLRPEQSSTTLFSAERISERTVEHHVDIPVPGREGRASGLQGFLPGQGSTALHERMAELMVEQFGDFSGGGLQDFCPGQSSSSSSHPHSRSELPPHSSPWTPAACDASMVLEEEEDDEPAIEYVECDGLWWGCEGSQLASSIAGGWPLPMGPRLAVPKGGRRGSSAAGDVSATMHDKFQQLPINSGWCLSSVHRLSGGYCRYATETGTHSVTLCFSGLVIDMPVVVHVKVVDYPVMAQLLFPLVQYSRPLRFTSCIPLIRCLTSLLRRSSYSRVQAARNWS